MKEPGNDSQDYSNFSNNETFDSIIRQRFSRRSILKGAAAAAPLLILGGGAVPGSLKPADAAAPLGFTPIAANRDDKVTVPPGYTANYLIGWGDPMFPGVDKLGLGASELDQTAGLQEVRFGYNADFIGYYPLPDGSNSSTNGILVVNHEYTNPELMWYGWSLASQTQSQVATQIAAHGVAIVEVAKSGRAAGPTVKSSPYNRRITGETPIEITGPAAGHDWLKTTGDPTGTKVQRHAQQLRRRQDALGHRPHLRGELQPVLRQPERPAGRRPAQGDPRPLRPDRRRQRARLGEALPTASTSPRSRTSRSASAGSSRSTPTTRTSTPKKRTALGRFKHEAANGASGQGRPLRRLHRRRRALRLRVQVRHRRHGTTPATAAPTSTCSTTARSTSPSSTTTAPAAGCRWSSARAR